MNWFSNLKVGTKLIGCFLIVSLIGAVIGTVGTLKAGQIHNLAQQMFEVETVTLRHADEANIQLLATGRAIRSAIMSTTEDSKTRHLNDTLQRLATTKAELDKASEMFFSDQGKALVAQTKTAMNAYEAASLQTIALLRSEALGDTRASTEQLFNVVRPLADTVDELMGRLVQLKMENAQQLNKQTEVVFNQIWQLLIAITLGGVLISAVIGLLITRSLKRQLGGEPKEVASMAAIIATGDLSTHIDASQAEPSSVVHAMQAMQQSLRTTVSTVRSSTDTIATASSQIAAGNQDLSSRTEEQASSLEQTAASMEELTSTVKQNADNARQANQLAVNASSVAVKGGEVVSQVVQTMAEINESSRKIVDIISVINSIAFQTNILALNAAVEAARAGEQGRGFAVVAAEVRNLAQRSAAAAKEIKGLIDNSVAKVEAGASQVSQAGQTMNEIVESVQRVTDIMAEITAASQEQTSGIDQINQAITQMDQVTQQNAALVEEAAAAAQSLQEQATDLSQVVSFFKLDTAENHKAEKHSSIKRHPTSIKPKSFVTSPRAKPPLAAPPRRLGSSKTNTADSSGSWETF
jgi:methyl-accepting chemotaxis protein